MNNNLILIADAGATKTDWVLITETGEILGDVSTPGINAVTTPYSDIENIVYKVSAELGKSPHMVFFYGAGCSTETNCGSIRGVLASRWPNATIEVASDLVGACRALLGHEAGIACILGTGSNSAVWNGEAITANTPPLGYILGDEGSGAALGKRLIADILKNLAPSEIREAFHIRFNLSQAEIIDKVYREPMPAKFLASFTPFISKNITHPYLNDLVEECFSIFFTRNLSKYQVPDNTPLTFTGSIAHYFRESLSIAAERCGYHITKIEETPIPGLIDYHKKMILSK